MKKLQAKVTKLLGREEGRGTAWGGGGLLTIIVIVILLILIF
ncbi:MAG: hypothetical protein ACR2HN_08655 [Tepidiformaceae bacterium]